MSKKSNNRFVVSNPSGGWDVKKPGAERASGHFEKQADAETYAKKVVGKKAVTKKAVTAPEVVDAVAETIKAAAPKKTAGLKAGKADKPASAASPVKKPVTRAAPAKKAAAAAAEATSGSLSETVVAAAPTEAPAA